MSAFIAEGFELSPQQKQLWRLQQAEPEQPYRAQCAVLIEGQIDVEILNTALRNVFARHEILHTTFSFLPGMKLPLQVITDAELAFDTDADLSGLSSLEQAARLTALLEQAKHLPFDFEHGPLAYASLVSISSSSHILVLTLGGLYVDSIGLDNLVGELSRSYTASLQDTELSEEPIQYVVASQYLNELLESDDAEIGREYWRKQGVSDLSSVKLSFEHSSPAITSFAPEVISAALDADLFARVKTLADSEGVSVASVLVAAWQVLFRRFAGLSELTVGLSCDGRMDEELREVVGLFARHVPLHSRVQGSSTFRKIVRQSDESVRDAYAFQDCFSWKHFSESNAGLTVSHFFPYCFEFVEQARTHAAADVSFSIHERYTCLDRFKVKLSCTEKNDSLTAEVHYDRNLFATEDARRLEGNFLVLLESAVNEPDTVVDQLAILSSREREQLLIDFNATTTTYPAQNVQQLFEQQVERTPHRVAVVFENQQFTYAELNSRANQLAHYLRRLGVGPGVLVALCLDRSIEMVVGLLGILKAGGAYLPLDPNYPIDRLTFMLQDAQAPVLLTQARLLKTLQATAHTVICLDTEVLVNESSENPVNVASACDIAYVLYTSGSTNRPKGVMIPHSAISNHMCWIQAAFAIDERDVVLQKTPFSFDASVWEFYAPLLAGGRLVMALPGGQQDSAYLLHVMTEQQVSLLQVVPSLLRLLLSEEELPACQSLRYLFVGGEALTRELQAKFAARLSGARLCNLYGPTETTIDASFHVCEGEGSGLTVPIGRPIANNRLYLLDQQQQLAPPGVAGELYIGGAGVGRGYLGRPELTAERFVPNPFSEAGERLYRTGDLCRYLADGSVEFLGRRDHQVKLRGYRVELGEIEAVLGQHPAVRAVAVLVKDDTHLVAYVVLDQEQSATTSELRSFLQQKLPEHMVPSVYIALDTMPLMPNGKVDRRALAALENAEPQSETEFVAPRNPIEEQLAAIWARRLGVEQIGINNDFFEMGGHSILASELMAEVRDTFQVSLPLRSLFEKPTVAGLAEAITRYREQETSAYVPVPVIVPAPEQRYEPFPLTDIQQAYWVGRSGAIELGNVSAHGYKEFDFIDLDVRRLERALQRLVERHDMLRAIILPDGQQQILKDVPPYEVKVLDVREQTPEIAQSELQAVREEMSHEVRSADQWPLFQVRASLLKNRRVRVHLSVDALIGDAWSWQLLGRELAQLYEDTELALVPLELSFRDYILAVESLREMELYRRSRDYWFGKLATLPPAPDLPLAANARSIAAPSFKRQTATLEPDAWRRMRARGAQSGLTGSGILLAAFAEVLTVWSKSPRFTINVTLFNRLPLHSQVNDILGDFTSVNLLAVDNSEPDTFENRARRIQERLWNDIDHRYLSGVEVIRELARLQGGSPRGAAMPIVFTSTLHHNTADDDNTAQSNKKSFTLANPEDDGYGINQTPQVWLDHQIYDQGGALVFNWDAVADLFPPGFLEDMFEAYCRLLEQLADDEASWQKPIQHLVSAKHLEQLAAINATATLVAPGLAHQIFISQVAARPQQAAVIAGNRTLTYEELYRRANQIGRLLRDAGAQPNDLVAVVMQKGWEQVVAVLGILQAGAAYLPIDAKFPQERIWSLLENGRVSWALTQSTFDQSLEWPENVKRLSVDQQEWEIDDHPLEPIQKPEDLAYVIYTSGSTGVPKGVMIEHRSVVNRITDVNQRCAVGPEDRAIALTALHHDLSVYDIFGVLGAGGTIVMPDAAATRDPSHWAELIVKHQVTLWNSVPAFMEMLVEHLENAGGPTAILSDSLRLVMMSGDWIPVTLPERLRVFTNGTTIMSLGGPTETTVWDICYPIQAVDPEWKSIPYGRPMGNAQYYVLDEALSVRPTWVPGELYLGGAGLARGYWHDEEKTRSKFIQHPQLGQRLYRSGDWGRYLPDGNIEFGGRADFQVKIQGYRVELGEIEAVLEQHPLIRSAVVTAVSQPQVKPRLVAYVVPKEEPPRENISAKTQAPAEGAVAYALERIDFKLKQLGLRHELDQRSSISLVKPAIDETLIATYQQRQSFRKFAEEPVTFAQLNKFLDNLLQLQVRELPLPKYRYPSAGNLYPVQTYLYVKPNRVEGVAGGVYYYHPKEHCLVLLSPDVEIDRSIHGPINQPTFDESAFSIFLISQYDAITPLYGDLARDFCTLEAGYMSQLLMMSAPDCGIGLCPVGNLDFDKIREHFALQDSHVFTHSLLGGRLAPDQALSWPSATAPAKSNGTSAKELQDFLRAKLPEYMVPSTFVTLETLPLTPNGKVDRRLLPAPDSDPAERTVAHVKPRNAVEQTIATIVQELLNVKGVGINDSFFELGGNSVDMVRFHVKLRETFNKDISIVEMFANPTISSLIKLFSQQPADPPSFKHSHDRAESRRASRSQRRQSRQERR
jgi:amino acid adenylation domain-containing protein